MVAHQGGCVKLAAAAAVDLIAGTRGQAHQLVGSHPDGKHTHLATGLPGNDDPCTHVPAYNPREQRQLACQHDTLTYYLTLLTSSTQSPGTGRAVTRKPSHIGTRRYQPGWPLFGPRHPRAATQPHLPCRYVRKVERCRSKRPNRVAHPPALRVFAVRSELLERERLLVDDLPAYQERTSIRQLEYRPRACARASDAQLWNGRYPTRPRSAPRPGCSAEAGAGD